jgi:membrane-bound serine protease (ClpP class)
LLPDEQAIYAAASRKSDRLQGVTGRFLRLLAVSAAIFAISSTPAPAARPFVRAISFSTDVNPVSADYVKGALKNAERDGASAAVIVLDTPGGLSDSMREIVKAELNSKIPVLVYVPTGARAASAGVWIGQAADYLAMAPASNIGSSTPISIGGGNIPSDERKKTVNDAAASLRSLARTHGRNVAWADAAVRKASNLTAEEALKDNVIDAVASSLPALLAKIDGVRTKPRHFVLQTAAVEIESVHMSAWQSFLNTLVNPTLITILLSLGMLGITIELFAPGHILPGTVGVISLVLALFGLSVLPISWAGLALMLFAFGLFGTDLLVPTHGALTLAGAICLVLGGLLLFEPAGPTYKVSLPVLIGVSGVLALALGFAFSKVVAIRRRPPTTGVVSIVGQTGTVRSGEMVFVKGELWQAEAVDGADLVPGRHVNIEAVEGLKLIVRTLDDHVSA